MSADAMPAPDWVSEPLTPVDAWRWRAHAPDGATYDEVGPDGDERGWHMARAALPVIWAIELVPVDPATHRPLWVNVPAGAEPSLGRLRRPRIHQDRDGLRATLDASVTEIGWTMGERACWVYARDDGTVAVCDHRQL